MRTPLIAGNWKMNLDLSGARALIQALREQLPRSTAVEVVVCPPFVYLFPVAKAIDGTAIRLGAQDAYHAASGAFTGEVSPAMLKETGCRYVILGHSERRHTIGSANPQGGVFGEDDEFINRKLHAVLDAGLNAVLCIGETLAQRERGQTHAVLRQQVHRCLAGVPAQAAGSVVIAYEPVWAIGTGRNATADQAQDAHGFVRAELASLWGAGPAADVRILYGGSLNAANAAELLRGPDVDGGLVGGASLKANEFSGIVRACLAVKGLA